MKRWSKTYREQGASGFFTKAEKKQKGSVMTPEVLKKAQQFFDEGLDIEEVSEKLDVKLPTLKYSIKKGKLNIVEKKQSTKVKER